MKRTRIQLQPTIVQLVQMIELIKKKGKNPEGHTYTWCFQLIFDSIIATQLLKGAIHNISEDEALKYLKEFSAASSVEMEDLELDIMNTMEAIENVEASPAVRRALEDVAEQDDLENIIFDS